MELATSHRQRTVLLLLATVVLWNAGLDLFWSSRHTFFPLYPDEAFHLEQVRSLGRALAAFDLGSMRDLAARWGYPPFFYLCAALWGFLFGSGVLAVTTVNVLFLALLLAAIQGCCQRWFSTRDGLVAILVTSLFPIVYAAQRWFLLDFSLAAMVWVALYALTASRGFRSVGWSLLAGLVLSLGVLTKFTFPVFLAGPVLYTLYGAKGGGSRPFVHAGLAFLTAFTVTSLHYNLFDVAWTVFHPRNPAYIPTNEVLGGGQILEALLFYPSGLPHLLSPPILAMLFLVMPFGAYAGEARRGRAMLLAMAVPSLVFFTWFPNKWARYLLPLVPVLAVFGARGLLSLPGTVLRRTTLGLLLALGLGYQLTLTFGRDLSYDHPTIMLSLQPSSDEDRARSILASFPSHPLVTAMLPDSTAVLCLVDSLPQHFLSGSLAYAARAAGWSGQVVEFPCSHREFVRHHLACNLVVSTRRPEAVPFPDYAELESFYAHHHLDFHLAGHPVAESVALFEAMAERYREAARIEVPGAEYQFVLLRPAK